MKNLKTHKDFLNEGSQEFEELKKMLKEQHGMLLMGFVHQIYGPLRDLSYILVDPEPAFLDNYLSKGWEKICTEIWKHTMLATKPMILPFEMIDQFEEMPPEFDMIKKAENYVREKLIENDPKQKEDPFYYRKGIL